LINARTTIEEIIYQDLIQIPVLERVPKVLTTNFDPSYIHLKSIFLQWLEASNDREP
jgi:hypothetical protein